MGEVGGLVEGEASDEYVYSSFEVDGADLCHLPLVAWDLPQAVASTQPYPWWAEAVSLLLNINLHSQNSVSNVIK